VIKKYVLGTHGGMSKIFWSSLYPTLGWGENFLRLSLISAGSLGNPPHRKPAYYTYKLMTEKLARATTVEKLDDYIYKFSFPSKQDVFVAWTEKGPLSINFSNYISSEKVKITQIVTKLDGNKNPIHSSDEVINAKSISIEETPVFIEPI